MEGSLFFGDYKRRYSLAPESKYLFLSLQNSSGAQ
jgi:hypothetical protein